MRAGSDQNRTAQNPLTRPDACGILRTGAWGVANAPDLATERATRAGPIGGAQGPDLH